jgi:hypothetical protein
MKQFFSSLIAPIGLQATVSDEWQNRMMDPLRVYNEGRLIVDPVTFVYKEFPAPTIHPPVITADEVKAKLPKTIEWLFPIYLTGSLVKSGWSGNDIDFIVFDETIPNKVFSAMKKYFSNVFGLKTDAHLWQVDFGTKVMSERDTPQIGPVYLCKIYEGGKCLLP